MQDCDKVKWADLSKLYEKQLLMELGTKLLIPLFGAITYGSDYKDLATWTHCFSLYVATLAPHQPAMPDLMAYQSLIAKASLKYKWPSWLVYDQNFCQEAAGNPSQESIYAQCFTGQTISKTGVANASAWIIPPPIARITHESALGVWPMPQGYPRQVGMSSRCASSSTISMVTANTARMLGGSSIMLTVLSGFAVEVS